LRSNYGLLDFSLLIQLNTVLRFFAYLFALLLWRSGLLALLKKLFRNFAGAIHPQLVKQVVVNQHSFAGCLVSERISHNFVMVCCHPADCYSNKFLEYFIQTL